MDMTTKLEIRPIAELIPYSRNARRHNEAQIGQLRASLREFGFVAPVLIDGQGNVLAGHARLEAARMEGLTEVPCVPVEHLTDTQRRAYILADNRLAEQADWDEELVSLELEVLREAGFDITLTGFDEGDILLDEFTDIREDAYTPELSAQPVARRGQVWRLGRHRLMCGDATEPADMEKLMSGERAHLLLTDPPYNVDFTGSTAAHLKLMNDKQDDAAFESFLESAFRTALASLEPGAAFYIWHADGPTGRLFRDACHLSGLQVRQCLIWVKNSATLSRQDYHWQHEPCLHGQTEIEALSVPGTWDEHEACIYGWKDGRPHLWCSDRKQTTVLEFDRPIKNTGHPTMKPVRLFAYQIANSTLPDAVVLDPFAGSGTTAIACEQMGRAARLMELDPRYVDVIIDRWERFTGQAAEEIT